MTRTPTLTLAAVALAPLLALAACDGGGDIDAGVDAPPAAIALSVTSASLMPSGRDGHHYFAVDLTLEARTEGPLGLAPNALTLVLEGGRRLLANTSATQAVEGGCTSRSVPEGSSASCRALFEVELEVTEADSLEWSDGTRTLTASVPPPSST